MVESKPLVLITGVSGFIGSQVLNEFLCFEGKDKYRIRCTVRDKNNAEKMKPLRDYFGEKLNEVEWFDVNLMNESQIKDAVKGCDYVVHTASPVTLENPRNHDDLIIPAVNGVTFVMRAAQANNVKRVVITSSVAAVSYMLPEEEPDEFDETCWSNVDKPDALAYMKSKTLAEKAAWNLQKEWQSSGQFVPEVVTICPGLVLGEVIAQGASSSPSMVKRIMNNEISAYPQLNWNCVDIKDVRLAHLRALERSEAANKRFILALERGEPFLGLADKLAEGLEERGWKITINRVGVAYCYLKFYGYFSSEVASLLPNVGKPPKIYNTKASRSILGIEYKRTSKEMLVECGESQIKLGTITNPCTK